MYYLMNEDIYLMSDDFGKWEFRQDREKIKEDIKRVQKAAASLTPAGRKMLVTLHDLFERKRFDGVDRDEIAAALKRPNSLSSWDRALLEKLCKVGFIQRRRVSLPAKVAGGKRMGNGAKFIYKMDINIGWRLAFIRSVKFRRSA